MRRGTRHTSEAKAVVIKTENGTPSIIGTRKRKSSSIESPALSPEEISPTNNGRQSRQRKPPSKFDPSDIHEKRKYTRRDSVSTPTAESVETKSTRKTPKIEQNGGTNKRIKTEPVSQSISSNGKSPNGTETPKSDKLSIQARNGSSIKPDPEALLRTKRPYRRRTIEPKTVIKVEVDSESSDDLRKIPVLVRQDISYSRSRLPAEGKLELGDTDSKPEVDGNISISDESNDAKSGNGENQETKPKILFDNFQGCDCIRTSINGQTFAAKSNTTHYCQARERRHDNALMGCANPVNRTTLYRISPQNTFSVFCNLHISKLFRHQCCPYCGEFCSNGGDIIRCTDGRLFKSKNKDPETKEMATHLFHLTCAAKYQQMVKSVNNLISNWKSLTELKCPHCGSEDMENLRMVRLTVTRDGPPLFLENQAQGIEPIPEQIPSPPPSPVPVAVTEEPELKPIEDVTAASINHSISVVPDETNTLYLVDDAYVGELESVMQKGAENPSSPVPADPFILEERLLSAIERLDIAEVIGLVLKCKYPLDQRLGSRNNMTLLHLAVESRNMCFIHAIVSLEPEFDIFDDNDLTPLMLAAKMDEPFIIKYLIAAGSDEQLGGKNGLNVLHVAVTHDRVNSVREIIERYPELMNTRELMNGLTSLMIAAKNGFTSIAVYLINSNLCNAQLVDNQRNSAMHWAAYSGSESILSALQSLPASMSLIEARNTFGQTPLDISFKENRISFMIMVVNKFSLSDLASVLENDPDKESKERHDIRECLKEMMEQRIQLMERDKSMKPSKILCRDISNGREQLRISCVNSEDETVCPTDFHYITVSRIGDSQPTKSPSELSISHNHNHNKTCRCTTDLHHLESCPFGTGTPGLQISKVDGSEKSINPEPCDCHLRGVYRTFRNKITGDPFPLDPIFECNELCNCDIYACPNRVVQLGIQARLQVFRVKPMTPGGESKGWGVRAITTIPLGGFICEYIGEMITVDEMRKLSDDSYVFYHEIPKLGVDIVLNSRGFGNVSRFINHSCCPNSVPVLVFTQHESFSRFPKIAFFARREIQAREEITFNYGSQFWRAKTKREPDWKCLCGTTECLHASPEADTSSSYS